MNTKPRRTPTPLGIELVAQAAQVCLRLGETGDEADDLRYQRRQLWLAANDEGATWELLAAECGCSVHLVHAEIAKARDMTRIFGA